MTLKFTPRQAAKIASKWNALAADRYNVSAAKIHLIIPPTAPDDLAAAGQFEVTVPDFQSVDEMAKTFTVTVDMVSEQ